MSLLAPTLQAFFSERLLSQRNASPRTIWNGTPCLTNADSSARDRALVRRKIAKSR